MTRNKNNELTLRVPQTNSLSSQDHVKTNAKAVQACMFRTYCQSQKLGGMLFFPSAFLYSRLRMQLQSMDVDGSSSSTFALLHLHSLESIL